MPAPGRAGRGATGGPRAGPACRLGFAAPGRLGSGGWVQPGPPAGPYPGWAGPSTRGPSPQALPSLRGRSRAEAVAADRRPAAGLDRRRGDAARRRPAAGARGVPRLVHPARPCRVRRGAGRRTGRAGHVAAPAGVRTRGRARARRHRLRHALPRRRRGHRDLRLPSRATGPAARARRSPGPAGAGRPVAHRTARGRGRRRRRRARPRPGRRLAPRRTGPRPPARCPAGGAAQAVGGADAAGRGRPRPLRLVRRGQRGRRPTRHRRRGGRGRRRPGLVAGQPCLALRRDPGLARALAPTALRQIRADVPTPPAARPRPDRPQHRSEHGRSAQARRHRCACCSVGARAARWPGRMAAPRRRVAAMRTGAAVPPPSRGRVGRVRAWIGSAAAVVAASVLPALAAAAVLDGWRGACWRCGAAALLAVLAVPARRRARGRVAGGTAATSRCSPRPSRASRLGRRHRGARRGAGRGAARDRAAQPVRDDHRPRARRAGPGSRPSCSTRRSRPCCGSTPRPGWPSS